ncbi:MAG: hypothetical protein KAR62_01525 [Sphingomonadales bacterium]|nr:hypothetical protein [Sphingomonadales bacterium]
MVDTGILLDRLEDWWMEDVYEKHKANVKKLKKSNAFNINPFLHPYIANFVYGDISPLSLAKALVLPRAMGTSVTTTFGSKMQNFIVTNIDHAKGSAIGGVDIEFEDQTVDNKPVMYCQVKAGPNTINADDVETITKKFTKLRKKAMLDGLDLAPNSSIVGVLYGERKELSGSYLNIEAEHGYGVFVGSEFWNKLTGDVDFYDKMASKLHSISLKVNEEDYIQDIINELSETDEIVALSKL